VAEKLIKIRGARRDAARNLPFSTLKAVILASAAETMVPIV